jgi:hypothetical protein
MAAPVPQPPTAAPAGSRCVVPYGGFSFGPAPAPSGFDRGREGWYVAALFQGRRAPGPPPLGRRPLALMG